MKRSTSAVLLTLAFALCPRFIFSSGAAWLAQAAEAVRSGPVARAPSLRPDQIKLLQDTLAAAPAQGFSENEFYSPALASLLQSSDPATRSRGEAALIGATVRYAAAVHRGRLPNAAFDAEWGMRPARFDAAAGFQQALAANKLQAWLADFIPPYTGYDQLVSGLKTYRDIVARGGWKPIAAGPVMKLGMADPRVPGLRERLAIEDPQAAKTFEDAQQKAPPPGPASQPAPSPPDPTLFDAALDQAVRAFESRHGLDPDGLVDKAVLKALNVTAENRRDQILANMERWRWVPPVLPADRVQVNIAAAVLTLFRADMPVLSMRVVPGRVSDHTPMLQSTIHSIVFNPPWNVPASIAQKELWPKERAHPGYFAKEDFAIIHLPEGGVRLQQRAGPKSALGRVKFDFDNPYGVYLHDTPTHGTFGRESRLASHGCVRLEEPKALAALLLQQNPAWTPATIDQTIAQADTKRVSLPSPTAVLIFYWTAFAGPDGIMNFRSDPYGWDVELMQRIAAGAPSKA